MTQALEQIRGAIRLMNLAAVDLEARISAPPPRLPSAIPEGNFRLSQRSLGRLDGVHEDLLAVILLAIRLTPVDFGIPATGGVRTPEMQRKLMAKGASKTLASRHLTGHAVDIYAVVGGKESWSAEHVLPVHDAIVEAAQLLEVPIRWGGDWDMDGKPRERGENDLVHHELLRRVYGTSKLSKSDLAAAFLRQVRA